VAVNPPSDEKGIDTMPKKKKASTKAVRPSNGITAGELENLITRFHKAIEQNSGNLIIDCSRVNKIDSPGLATVLSANNSCLDVGGKVVLTGVDEKITDVFHLLGLEQQIEIHSKTKGAAS